MDLLYLLKEDFKNLLFDLLIIGRRLGNLSYLSSCLLHKDEDSEEYARTYSQALNQTLFTLVFLVFLKIQWFFLECSSLAYTIFRFLVKSYKTTELQPLWISN